MIVEVVIPPAENGHSGMLSDYQHPFPCLAKGDLSGHEGGFFEIHNPMSLDHLERIGEVVHRSGPSRASP